MAGSGFALPPLLSPALKRGIVFRLMGSAPAPL
jgi:hypothetical protein